MPNHKPIPFMDLKTPHLELADELVEVFREAVSTARFIGGPQVEGFEEEFARYCDAQHSVGVGSGTDAVRFALMACGVKEGDSVVTVPFTFIATTEAISQAGALPEFVDIDSRTFNIDPEALSKFLREGCRRDGEGRLVSRRSGRPVTAVVPVHIYGQPVDMDAVLELAAEFGLQVIEDSAQAVGADYFSRKEDRWRRTGSMGRMAAFSFYPGKNLGACGEAGAVTTNDAELAAKVRMIRDHGQAKKYYHDLEGYNGRLDAIQAGALRIKLRRLDAWTEARRQRAEIYDRSFRDLGGLTAPYQPGWVRSVYHLYVVRVANRDRLAEELAADGIGSGLHYPMSLHQQKAYDYLGYAQGDFPESERAASEIISLPLFPELSSEDQARVCERVKTSLSSSALV